jgi:hypothetical protein
MWTVRAAAAIVLGIVAYVYALALASWKVASISPLVRAFFDVRWCNHLLDGWLILSKNSRQSRQFACDPLHKCLAPRGGSLMVPVSGHLVPDGF